MMDAQTTSAPPEKRPRSGPGTWKRHYCDPAVSPKHAKLRTSPRTSPERTPRSQELELPVLEAIAAMLGPYARHEEPPSVVADVLLRVLPMPDCARSTIAIVVHRKGTGTCNDLTYRQASALGACDRRTAINRFARTESYGFIHMEQRDHPWGGAAPNLITAQIPTWVYQQVDDFHTAAAPVPGAPAQSESEPAEAGTATATSEPAGPVSAGADVADAVPASPAPGAVAWPSEGGSASDAAAAATEPSRPAPVLSPEDAAIDARLDMIHAFTGQRLLVAAIRRFNAQEPKAERCSGAPRLDDEQILIALDQYIKKQRPIFERKKKYRERLPDRNWVENGIHVFLWGRRQASSNAREARARA